MRIRFWLLFLGTLTLYSLLGFNLYTIQIKKSDYYTARAAAQFKHGGFLSARRGSIYLTDKNGNRIAAAIDKKYSLIFAVPKEIKDPEGAARRLEELLKQDRKSLLALLQKPEDTYEILVEKATDETMRLVKNADIEGIYFGEEEKRFYPFDSLASHLIGYVGKSGEDEETKGRYGLEKKYDEYLRGEDGYVDGDRIIQPIEGQDLSLTIDRNIQARAEEILETLITTHHASGGTILVQEPKSGKILAMAGNPNFNPNDYGEFPISSFLNPAVQAIYEPGSIWKVITMAVGLDVKKITPETTYYDNGFLTLDGRTIKNWDQKAHGMVTMTEVIEQSINTGAAFVSGKIGRENFYQYLKKFGTEEITGISLPGEVHGSLESLREPGRGINFATVSFGQGVAVTPLGLITMISAIANGGDLMKPYIFVNESPLKIRSVIGSEAAKSVTEMMVKAVSKAKVAAIPGYRIAGKTGTAEIPDFKHGGYADRFIHSYAGFVPASNPRFAALIKINEPNAELAGTTVVPAFKELTQFILNYYGIPPDDIQNASPRTR